MLLIYIVYINILIELYFMSHYTFLIFTKAEECDAKNA